MEQGLSSLIFLGLLVAIFYFMLIRPQKRRMQQHKQLIESVDTGDTIVTMSGMYGTVKSIGNEEVELEISPGTTVRLMKNAIGRRVTEDLDQDV